MKKIWCSLLFLPTIFFFVPSSASLEAVAELDNSKTIYVDFSMVDEATNPSISFGEQVFPLSVEEGDIYKSESSISDVLLLGGFSICYDEDYAVKVNENSPLTNPLYNYIYINKDNTVGYGLYGKSHPNDGATAATQRIWLSNDNQDFYTLDPWGKPYRNAVAYLANNEYRIVLMENVRNSFDSHDYYYCDIPAEANMCRFLRLSSNNYLIAEDNEVLFRQYGVCYLYVTKGNISTMNVPSADADILGLVVEAYLTYGKLPSNGSDSETVANLFTTWFKDKSASSEDLKSHKIKDYTGEGYKDGEYHPEVPKTSEFSINEKWNTLCSQAGIDPKTGANRSVLSFLNLSGNTWNIVGLVGVTLLVLAIGAIAMLIKNKSRVED